MEDPLSSLWTVLFILFLIILSATFSASETALTSISRHKLRKILKEGTKEEEESELHFFNKLLTTLLISNNLVNIMASSFATILFASFIQNPNVSALVSTLVMTFTLLVFAEITPKIIARQKSERIFERTANFILFLSKMFAPFIKLFISISNMFVRLFGGTTVSETPIITVDDIASYVEMGREEGTIDYENSLMIKRTIEMDETLVKEIMIPRIEVVAVEESSTLREVIEVIKKEEYSRLPVYRETIDNIVGVIYAKDLLAFVANRGSDVLDKVKARELMREPLFVPEVMPVSTLLKEFKTKKMHMAIVVDEYGGTAGIATLEDILEEIFGEIMDEYDENESSPIKKISEDSYLADGTVPINDLERELMIPIPEGDYDTLAGFLLENLQHIPKVGDEIQYENVTFKIVGASKNRIEKVLIKITPQGNLKKAGEEDDN